MVRPLLSRREFFASFATLSVLPGLAWAEGYIDLEWDDLLAEGQSSIPNVLQGIFKHDEPNMSSQQPPSTGVRTDWNGKTVRLPGFIVPLKLDGTGVTEFILAPFVGACVHVPPPPANQLVFVTTDNPFESPSIYHPVNVTGRLNSASISTELASVGYALSAKKIEPYT